MSLATTYQTAGPVAAYEYLFTADRNEPFPDPLFSPQIRLLKINDLQGPIKKGLKRLLAHIFL
ncbi:hypothetical protein K5D32_17505 [Pseudomonas cichorii]|uniref:hypothetical protein n=1 Tax=Pseudomonas cichorii TaxID=36746 RepID=UPI001C891261|nr:hypothetical protein [Pseudomonas cichorii]MBX8531472.1 hypothetical protein [Pseudomonas cichorii]